MDEWWRLLKAIGGQGSYRMNPTSTFSAAHLPTEIDFDQVREHLAANPESNLGDLVGPYLTGQFSPAAPEPEEGGDTEARSFQQQAARQRTPGLEERQQVDAPFPLTSEEAAEHVDYMRRGKGYSPSGKFRWDLPGQSAGHPSSPSYQALARAISVLQGRLRQGAAQDEFEFEPQATMGGKKGVSAGSHAPRLSMYANTPVSAIPRTTTQATGRVGVRGEMPV